MTAAYGTAPRKINGVWYTRTGRRLTAAQARIWDSYVVQGRFDTSGHRLNQPRQKPVSATQLSERPKKPKVQGGATLTTPQQILTYKQTGKLPAYGPTPQQKRQQRIYQRSQQAGREAEATRGNLLAAKGYHQPVFEKAAKAAPVINPVAGEIIKSVSPGPGIVKGIEQLRRGKVLAGLASAGLSASIVVPGGGGFRIAKGAEKAAAATRALSREEAIAHLAELEKRHEKLVDAAVKSLKGQGKFSQEERTYTNVARGQYKKGKRLTQPPTLEQQTRQNAVDALDKLAEKHKAEPWAKAYAAQRDTITHLRNAIAETDPLVGTRAAVEGEFGSRQIPQAVKSLTPGQLAKQRLVPQTSIFPRLGRSQEVLPMPSEEAIAAREAFAGSKSGYKAQEVLRSQQISERAAKMGPEYQKAGGGVEGVYAKKRALRGAYEKVPFNDFQNVPKETIDQLQNEVEASHLLPFEKLHLQDAINAAHQKNVRPRPFEVSLMEKAFGPAKAIEFAETGGGFMDRVSNILNIPRSVMASGDLSAPFRQGLMAFAMNPVLASKQMPKMAKAFVSEGHYQLRQAARFADPEYENSIQAGVRYTELGASAAQREEQYMSSMAETITGVGALVGKGKGSGSFVRMSGRAYTEFLDELRLAMYKQLKAEAQAAGRDLKRVKTVKGGTAHPTTLDEDIGILVNWATGRGTFKHRTLENASPLLNSFLFSPRLFKSRLDAMNPNFYRTLDPFAARKAAQGVVSLVATGVSILALAKYVGGADVEVDPRSSDFGKIRFGKTRYDIWGGYQQVARTIAQELVRQQKSSTTGTVKKVTQFTPTLNLLKGKASPPLSVGIDVQAGEMFGSQPVTLKNELVQKGTPILWQDIFDAIHTGSWQNTAASIGLGALGVGTQTYSSQRLPAKRARHPGSGRFIKKGSLPTAAEIARELGHGSGLPTAAEIARELGH